MRMLTRTNLFALAAISVGGLYFLPLHGQEGRVAAPAATPAATAATRSNGAASVQEITTLPDLSSQLKAEILQLSTQLKKANSDAELPPEMKALEERLKKLVEDQIQKEVSNRLQHTSNTAAVRLAYPVVTGPVAPESEGARTTGGAEGGGMGFLYTGLNGGTNRMLGLWVGSPTDQSCEETTRALLAQYDQYTDANRAEFFEKLKSQVTQHFDIKQAAREAKLVQLEEQLKKLRTLHAQRAKEKDKIISDRVNQLSREAAGLGWPGETQGNTPGVTGSGLSLPSADSFRIEAPVANPPQGF